jgi:hypothetical protein
MPVLRDHGTLQKGALRTITGPPDFKKRTVAFDR